MLCTSAQVLHTGHACSSMKTITISMIQGEFVSQTIYSFLQSEKLQGLHASTANACHIPIH